MNLVLTPESPLSIASFCSGFYFKMVHIKKKKKDVPSLLSLSCLTLFVLLSNTPPTHTHAYAKGWKLLCLSVIILWKLNPFRGWILCSGSSRPVRWRTEDPGLARSWLSWVIQAYPYGLSLNLFLMKIFLLFLQVRKVIHACKNLK